MDVVFGSRNTNSGDTIPSHANAGDWFQDNPTSNPVLTSSFVDKTNSSWWLVSRQSVAGSSIKAQVTDSVNSLELPNSPHSLYDIWERKTMIRISIFRNQPHILGTFWDLPSIDAWCFFLKSTFFGISPYITFRRWRHPVPAWRGPWMDTIPCPMN